MKKFWTYAPGLVAQVFRFSCIHEPTERQLSCGIPNYPQGAVGLPCRTGKPQPLFFESQDLLCSCAQNRKFSRLFQVLNALTESYRSEQIRILLTKQNTWRKGTAGEITGCRAACAVPAATCRKAALSDDALTGELRGYSSKPKSRATRSSFRPEWISTISMLCWRASSSIRERVVRISSLFG